MNRLEVKKEAWKKVKDNKLVLWKPILLLIALGFLSSFFLGVFSLEKNKIVNSAITFLTLPLSVGLVKYYLNFYRNELTEVSKIFMFYKKFLTIVIIALLVSTIVVFGFVLFLFPGIIFSMMFAQVYYLLADGEENIIEIMKKSKKLMIGNKMDLFLLNLSFFGWIFLSILTFGILFIWTIPYIEMAQVTFYEKIKNKPINV